MQLTLPYPPSVNHYWRRNGARYFIGEAGQAFRRNVHAALLAAWPVRRCEGLLDVSVTLHPPDRRRRDVDNVLKALLDGLKHGGVYEDDSQVKRISVEMCDPRPPAGMTLVEIGPYPREAK